MYTKTEKTLMISNARRALRSGDIRYAERVIAQLRAGSPSATKSASAYDVYQQLMAAPAPARRRGSAPSAPRQVWDHEHRYHVTVEGRGGRLRVEGWAAKSIQPWPFGTGRRNILNEVEPAVMVTTDRGCYLLSAKEVSE